MRKWLKEMPPTEEITDLGGVVVLLANVVKDKLDTLTDGFWETKDYQSKYVTVKGITYISASLVLIVRYDDIPERKLVGAVTFRLDYFPENTHWDNTAKTLCIVNAASDLGNQFGRHFNKVNAVVDRPTGIPKKESIKMKPDVSVLKMYSDAIVAGDTEKINQLSAIYELEIPE